MLLDQWEKCCSISGAHEHHDTKCWLNTGINQTKNPLLLPGSTSTVVLKHDEPRYQVYVDV